MDNIFGFKLDCLSLDEAVSKVIDMAFIDGFKYVVTPNADHVVNLHENKNFRSAYADASMVVADGWPVVHAGRMLGLSVPERVAGSDLVPAVLEYAESNNINIKVYILGGIGDVPHVAAVKINEKYPSVNVVGYFSPPFGFEKNNRDVDFIIEQINRSDPDIIIVGLGSPKQELFVYGVKDRINRGVAICAGATVDFLAGSVKRAPKWISSLGLEWLYRTYLEPRRMIPRYGRVLFKFPFCLFREFFRKKLSN